MMATTQPADGKLLSLSAAARLAGTSTAMVRAAVERGAVRARRVRRVPAERILFAADEFAEDLDQLRCRHPSCSRFALGTSGGCRLHVQALSRKYVDEKRWCEWCGEALGVVLGRKLAKGHGRFCDNRCAALAQHAPQKAGAEVTCPGCGVTRYRRPSVLARRQTSYCGSCYRADPEYRAALRAAAARSQQRFRDEVTTYKSSERLLDADDVAELCGLLPDGVRYHVASGALAVTKVARFADGRRRVFFDDRVVKQWLAAHARNDDPRHRSWLSPMSEVARLTARGELERLLTAGLARGVALAALEAQAAENVARRRKINRRRAGRRSAEEVRQRRERREARLLELEDDLRDYCERRPEDTPKSVRYEAARTLAVEEAGRPLTADEKRDAATRILIDVQRLQEQRTSAANAR
jgi:hypothetical protein